MGRTFWRAGLTGFWAVVISLAAGTPSAAAAPNTGPGQGADHARIVAFWTAERRAAAIPRDLVLDRRGQAYLRLPGGALQPYGLAIAASAPGQVTPQKRPGGGGGGDTTGPSVTDMKPSEGATIGASYTFHALVTDPSGVRSVSFVVKNPSGTTQSFKASSAGSDAYEASLQGFTDGSWSWWVVAKDQARNTTTSGTVNFEVSTGSGGGGGTDIITNAHWTAGGAVQWAVGRLYFQMPSNSRWTRWTGYVCSGTVVTDSTSGRSVILTAAHCVYDDANKAFARNVLFIPDQDGTTGSGTDLNCSNDPIGCWTPSFGVVDQNWTTRTFPDNIPWDYAYYVVPDEGAHSGAGGSVDAVLDGMAGSMSQSFGAPATGVKTYAFGYSYDADPNLMYCAEGLATEGSSGDWWLGSCGLSGGSSGGSWYQPFNTGSGSGSVISVNSWGYTSQPGMAGPRLSGTSAANVFCVAKTTDFSAIPGGDGYDGVTYAGQACP